MTSYAMQIPPPTTYNGFDWFLILLVLLSAILAFRRGIVRVLFSIVGLVAGISLASWNYVAVAHDLSRWILSFQLAEIVSFVVLLVVVVLLFGLAGSAVRKAVSAVGLGFVDRLLGAIVGLLRGGLLGVLTLMALSVFAPDSAWIRQSQLAPYFLEGVHEVSFVVPDPFQQQISEGTSHLMKQHTGPSKAHTLKQRSE